ncbi:MAG: undecaprenyl/decaprenyl-phosphate alpha-N-acetylglucosaminyl 1-phosphate transferase [Clostridia bacterium]|nr:undecaprenyl/decaprenyl-phosphate alpha-N-acetylglucosaminyl 1-phosphate transferase [Clostridia bacterium]
MQVLNLIISFLISLLLVPLNRKLSIKLGVVSYPRERDAHKEPTPRMGGLSVAISFIFSVLIFMFFTQEVNVKKCLFIIAGAVVLTIVGVIDDIYQIKPYQKMAGQILAIILAIIGGVNVRFLVWDTPGIFAIFIKCLNIFGTLFWIVGMINAINLIDGLDGLSSGLSTIASISFMVIAVTNGNTLAMLLAVSLAGATLGFLAHNFHPASIFIGDTGSMLLGYTLSLIALETGFEYLNIVCFMAPLIILAVPIFDTAFAILRRIINRMPISEADKNHTHHKLMRKGFKYRTVVLILYAFAVAFGITGVCISRTQSPKFIILAIVLILLLMITIHEKKDKKVIEEKKEKNK